MGYVRSRKFCCCLPVRFGVFCMALLGLVGGGVFSVFGWIQVHRYFAGDVDISSHQKVALWFVSLSYTWLAMVSVVGLWGSISKRFGCVSFYAYTVTVNTILIIAVGIYFVWTLFHANGDKDVSKCVGDTDGDLKDIKHWVCQKGFDVLRIVIVIVFCIMWIFQLVGIFIVFDYLGQRREEIEAEGEDSRKSQPTYVVTAPSAGPAMRTTYDAAPYEANPNGWASAKSPYAFATPGSAQVAGR